MLLADYSLEIFKSKCQPGAMGVHCHAHFKQNVGCALPYLNTVLGGFEYIAEPPSLTLKAHGKMTSVFERYLTLWVFLCIIAGILLGKIAPGVSRYLDGLAIQVNDAPVVSIPIAVCLF